MAAKYEHCFLIANSRGVFRDDYIRLNDIHDSYDDNTNAPPPEFVARHERSLNQPRKFTPEVRFSVFGVFCF